MPDHKLGFINVYKSSSDSFIGGILITDHVGLPVEFRHTETISPTKIQKILYGKAIDFFLRCESIAKALLNDLENKPEILIVPDESYFQLTKLYKFPFVLLANANRQPLAEVGDVLEISENEILLQILSIREPIRIRVDKKNVPTLAAVKMLLLEVGRTMDVLEPILRVEEALKSLIND